MILEVIKNWNYVYFDVSNAVAFITVDNLSATQSKIIPTTHLHILQTQSCLFAFVFYGHYGVK